MVLNIQFFGGRGASAGTGKKSAVSEPFKYNRDPELKEWSDAEQKRAKETTRKIIDKLETGGWNEFYEEEYIETVETYNLQAEGYRDEEITLDKMTLVYAQNWDEKDNRVKKGKAIAGTTYYTVNNADGAIDEETPMYKTKADALHAMKLFIDREKQWRAYQAKKKG